jgi:hypothetical protein
MRCWGHRYLEIGRAPMAKVPSPKKRVHPVVSDVPNPVPDAENDRDRCDPEQPSQARKRGNQTRALRLIQVEACVLNGVFDDASYPSGTCRLLQSVIGHCLVFTLR